MGELLRLFTVDRNSYKRNSQQSAEAVAEQIELLQQGIEPDSKVLSNVRAALANYTGVFFKDGSSYRTTELAEVFQRLYLLNPVDAWQWLVTRSLWHYVVPNGTNATVNRHVANQGVSFGFFSKILGLLVHLQSLPGDARFLYYTELCALLNEDENWEKTSHELFFMLIQMRNNGEFARTDRTLLGDLEDEYGISRDNLNGVFHKAFRQTGLFEFTPPQGSAFGIALSQNLTTVMQTRIRHILDHPLVWQRNYASWHDFLQLKEDDLPIEVSAPQDFEPEPLREPGNISPTYTLEEFVRETGFEKAIIETWKNNLDRKMHIIFQGPPGTGKTFIAQRLARLKVSGTTGFWEIVQFHPTYSYEDFMQGIFPETDLEGNLYYRLKPGRFLEFCQRAQMPEILGAPCVLVVDEINRANLSRVFGELMYLLEYRDRSIPLAGGGREFRIPSNVFIIGTMNTADRSIALVDHALRRRFVFVRLSPEYQVLKTRLEGLGLPAQSLVNTLKLINREIGMSDYEIGISFFMSDDNLAQRLPDIWKGEIEPYLEEFFFDQPEKVTPFRWDSLKEAGLRDWSENAPGR